MYRKLIVVILLLVKIYDLSASSSDKFNEELFVKALPSGHVYTYFQFTTEWLVESNESCKYSS